MKFWNGIAPVAACFLLAACGVEKAADQAPEPEWQDFTATAYTVSGETASGKQTREGRTVAADHSVLPLGTRIEIKDAGPHSGIYVVQDGGPKVNGRQVDIFMEDHGAAKEFGRKQVRLRVLDRPEPATK